MRKSLAYAFFYGYVGLLVLAGGWGILFARIDHQLLLGLDPASVPSTTQANVLSQYRFLRATELAFGAYALAQRRAILAGTGTTMFLALMAIGVVARAVSLVLDGSPSPWFYFFFLSELVGVVCIYAYVQPERRTR
jgi:hypothetical protein